MTLDQRIDQLVAVIRWRRGQGATAAELLPSRRLLATLVHRRYQARQRRREAA